MKTREFALVFTLALAACTSSSSRDPENTIYLSQPEKIKTTDPAHANDLYSGTMSSYAYEGLLNYHYLKRPFTLQPALAETMPKVSADGKTFTIKIKQGVLFQDDPCFKSTNGKGRELTAEDFVYSFKRVADPKEHSTGWWIFDNRIVGLNEWRKAQQEAAATDFNATVEGLQAIDRYTLQIKLKERSYQFLYYLAMPHSFVVAREAVEFYGKDFLRNPVGTGPFVLNRKESNLNSKLIWDRNPTYRKVLYPSDGDPGDAEKGLLEDAGKSLPFVDRVVTHVFVESQPQWLNFMAGKLDASGIPKDNYSQAISPSKDLTDDLKQKGLTLHKQPSLDVTHESFNMADPLFAKNKYLRQAISLAIDIEPMIDLLYNGRAVAAQGPIPPGLAGYDPAYKNPYRKYDLARAKELMKKAGFPDGKGLPAIDYLSLANSTSRQFTEYFEKSLAKIGVKLKVTNVTWPEFQAALKNRKGQFYGFAWSADYPDAENFLQLFYGKNVSPGPNDANYVNPEFDRLYEQSLRLPDSPQRTALYRKMVDIVVEDAPWVFGVHRIAFGLTYPWLKNYKINEMEHNKAKYYRIDTELRKKLKK